MRLGIIINPAAGQGSGIHQVNHIVEFCARERCVCVPITLRRGDRIEDIASELTTSADIIGVVGGDGTLNGVINGIMRSPRPDIPLAFFPTGRGKDVARTLLSWHPKEIRHRSLMHHLRKVDLGRIESNGETRYFLNETSIGVGALAAEAASKLPRKIGTVSYLAGTIQGLVRGRPFNALLTTEDQDPVELHQCHHITIANGRYFGGGLQIAPTADPEDGLLEIIAVADVSALTIAKALPRLVRATHLSHPAVKHWRSSRLQLETSIPVLVESDGEVWTSTPLTISTVSQALTWMEPA